MGILLPCFDRFPDHFTLIGRMLVGYGELEVALMNCVQVIRLDLDAVVKAMFRVRGEEQRLRLADALGRPKYHKVKLGTQFEMAVGAVKHCLTIRNQYAHCQWFGEDNGRLAFVNLEELAAVHVRIKGLVSLTKHYVDLPLLNEQLAYFVYAQDSLNWVHFEGRVKARRLRTNPFKKPRHLKPPAVHHR